MSKKRGASESILFLILFQQFRTLLYVISKNVPLFLGFSLQFRQFHFWALFSFCIWENTKVWMEIPPQGSILRYNNARYFGGERTKIEYFWTSPLSTFFFTHRPTLLHWLRESYCVIDILIVRVVCFCITFFLRIKLINYIPLTRNSFIFII